MFDVEGISSSHIHDFCFQILMSAQTVTMSATRTTLRATTRLEATPVHVTADT